MPKSADGWLPSFPVAGLDRVLIAASRHSSVFLLLAVCSGIAIIGAFVVRDLRSANEQAQHTYDASMRGMQRVGDLQYDTQETRRATLYALTTTDPNLQVNYADQTREADLRVREGIGEYQHQAKSREEMLLAVRLGRDWTAYLAVRDEVLASILEGSTQEATARDLAGGVPAFEKVRQDLKEAKRLYADDAQRTERSVEQMSRRSASRLAGILAFTFLLACVAVWAIQRAQLLGRMQLASMQMEFVASVSHELRTPVAVIRAAADNLADGIVQSREALHRYGTVLRHQSSAMSELVDQILLFASTEARGRPPELHSLAVEVIFEAVLSQAEALAKNSGVRFEVNLGPDLPPVLADLAGVTRILSNIIGNAIKYGGEDRLVAIRAWSSTAGQGDREVCIAVKDSGMGMPAEEIRHIFEPFYRSPRVQAAQIHGTGLGLSVAKRIAESMGATISVTSQTSRGSTFTLHLKAASETAITSSMQASAVS